ncbi:MAG: ParA family partition ATPase [Magnetovibrionaceae bacterium]
MAKSDGASILTVAQQKGGAGKTTLVAQLAVALAGPRQKVAVVDIDPQGSLTAWYGVREQQGFANDHLDVRQVSGWRTASEIDRLRNEFDLILIDSPPHAETDAKVAVRAADLVLIPVQPSPLDVWATKPTIDLALGEKVPVLLLMNRVPPRAKIVEEVSGWLAQKGLPVADTRLGNRVAFASSMMEGKGVMETAKRSSAAQEIEALAKEIKKAL